MNQPHTHTHTCIDLSLLSSGHMYCPDGGICWNVHNKNAFTPGIRELIALNMNPRLFPFVLLEQSLTFNNILSLFIFLDHFYCYAIRILKFIRIKLIRFQRSLVF